MPTVSLHYWAGAQAAAGVTAEQFEASTVREAFEFARQQRSDPRFERVMTVSSALIDGVVAHDHDLDAKLLDDVQVEILPPFAGG